MVNIQIDGIKYLAFEVFMGQFYQLWPFNVPVIGVWIKGWFWKFLDSPLGPVPHLWPVPFLWVVGYLQSFLLSSKGWACHPSGDGLLCLRRTRCGGGGSSCCWRGRCGARGGKCGWLGWRRRRCEAGVCSLHEIKSKLGLLNLIYILARFWSLLHHFDTLTRKQVKPGFTNYQPQPKYSWALLSKIEGKGN